MATQRLSADPGAKRHFLPGGRAPAAGDKVPLPALAASLELIAEQGPRGTSYGGWLADEIQRRFFDWLDHPVERVTGGIASPSISKVLERAAIARLEEVVEALQRIGEA